jgi:hypothetical protein
MGQEGQIEDDLYPGLRAETLALGYSPTSLRGENALSVVNLRIPVSSQKV